MLQTWWKCDIGHKMVTHMTWLHDTEKVVESSKINNILQYDYSMLAL